ADNAASMSVKEFFDTGGYIALQKMFRRVFFVAFQSEFFDARLALSAGTKFWKANLHQTLP
ncbi:hypothetical protein, partial [Bacillus cereus group sp. Bce001]|uniref:hypothetical protein n=1 Tax=Bacillus cereus group sp. Bce001 TaxID=3445260 RepID=UPI003F239F82